MTTHPGYARFPDGFFDRGDEADDVVFYQPPRLVTHMDEPATAAVSQLYHELGIDGRVLDMMGSWVSHFTHPPEELSVLGMNATELASNSMATSVVVHDLNADPRLPFEDAYFDDVVCAVSVDYLVHPLEVFADVRRVLRPQGRLVCTFSNRCFPTKAIRGWLMSTERQRCELVAMYFELAGGFERPVIADRSDPDGHDPLYAVWGSVQPLE